MANRLARKKFKVGGKRIVFILLLLSVAIVWGGGFSMLDKAHNDGKAGSFTLVGVRFTLAAFALFLLRLCLKKSSLFRPVSKRDVAAGIVVGIINFFGFWLQTIGIGYTNPANNAMLTVAYVVMVPLMMAIGKGKLRVRSVVIAAVFFAGMVLVTCLSGGDWSGFNRGDVISLVAAVFFALQIIGVDRAHVNALNFTVIQLLTMGVLGIVGAAAFEVKTFSSVDFSSILLPVLYLSLLSSCYAYAVQAFAQKYVSPSLTSILISLESIISVIIEVVRGSKACTAWLVVGVLVMFGAVIVSSLIDSEKGESVAVPPATGKETFFEALKASFGIGYESLEGK